LFGGGVGTANLLHGIKDYFLDINAVVSKMAMTAVQRDA